MSASTSIRDKAADWWKTVPPERKRAFMIAAILVVIFGVSAIFDKRERAAQVQKKPNEPAKLDMNVVTAARKEEGVAELRAQVDILAQQLKNAQQAEAQLKQELSAVKDGNAARENAHISELARDLAGVKEELRTYRSDVLGQTGSKSTIVVPPLPDAVSPQKALAQPAVEEVKKPKIVIINGSSRPGSHHAPPALAATAGTTPTSQTGGGKPSAPATPVANAGAGQTAVSAAQKAMGGTAGATPTLTNNKLSGSSADVSDKSLQFLPAGTMFRGVLLNGIDAPTSSLAQRNPVPALMRVKTLAFLPNHVTQDIRECFIILAGFGVLSSERAKMRTESISCVRNDGGVIETPLDGFAVGDDGKEGIGGRLVTKQGSMIARSLVTGVLGGLAKSFAPTAIPVLNTSTNSGWQAPDASSMLTAGALGGMQQATTDIAKFYLDTAKEMHPVVEVPSETEVTVVLVRGASLALAPIKPVTSSRSSFWR